MSRRKKAYLEEYVTCKDIKAYARAYLQGRIPDDIIRASLVVYEYQSLWRGMHHIPLPPYSEFKEALRRAKPKVSWWRRIFQRSGKERHDSCMGNDHRCIKVLMTVDDAENWYYDRAGQEMDKAGVILKEVNSISLNGNWMHELETLIGEVKECFDNAQAYIKEWRDAEPCE